MLNKPVQLSSLPPTSAAAHQHISRVYYQLGCCQCNGKASFNSSRYESDLNEYCTFDPEALRDLEANILDDENNGNESQIFD
ncbi:hypothetical protein TNCV_3269521 [Trichonephila clavipes]|nr:hypothetical protein TNCV_3269521 [Trichonephila clavipes]